VQNGPASGAELMKQLGDVGQHDVLNPLPAGFFLRLSIRSEVAQPKTGIDPPVNHLPLNIDEN
jgi:hypothetical protein